MKRFFSRAFFFITLFAIHTSFALPTGWQEIKPGGETLCARGSEYAFLVHKGDPKKIVVSFGAGGACWDDFTCDSDRIYTDTVIKTYNQVQRQAGIFDFQNKKNPYKNWTHIFIPYCTGDVHLGTRDATYTRSDNSTFVIHHRGAINTKAVLNWMAENYKTATEINVDGCSAGSYGSVVWAPTIAENYTQAKILQFGDSGAGVSPSLFFPQWGIEKALPQWIPALNPGKIMWSNLNIVDIYKAVADYYPQAHFSQFNHEEDRIQILYYAAMGGDGLEWTPRMFKNMDDTSSIAGGFRYFIAPGHAHCAMNNASFYTTKSDGVILRDWLDSSISGKNFENVKCTECKTRLQ
ncbi:MAG: pectin acetylesterase-family hydrolase [Pseudobdellovibrionaceae bacterium]